MVVASIGMMGLAARISSSVVLKRRARAGQERDKCAAKLCNANFVANAPAEVVTQERDRLAEYERQVQQLGEQLRRLAAVQDTGDST